MSKQTTPQQTALAQLPKPIQHLLSNAEQLSYFSKQMVDDLQQATGLTQAELGLSLLPLAASYAVTPVSHFHVGAIAFDSIGNAYLGANFEFANTHIGQTIHAEQSAIAHAWQRGATDLALLVINYPPCGHCRQFINEVNLASDFKIQLPNSTPQPLSYYLPDSFGGSDLGIEEKLLSLPNPVTSQADLQQLAQMAHDACHAPYSGSKSGIALQYADGEIVTGRYAENAAFNPTLPALQVALNYRRLQGKNWQDIQHAILVETVTTLSQADNTRSLLQQICDVELAYVSL